MCHAKFAIVLLTRMHVAKLLFTSKFPRLVTPSYVVAFGYCGLDALNAGYKEWNTTGNKVEENSVYSREARIAYATFDTLLWQSECTFCRFVFCNI